MWHDPYSVEAGLLDDHGRHVVSPQVVFNKLVVNDVDGLQGLIEISLSEAVSAHFIKAERFIGE